MTRRHVTTILAVLMVIGSLGSTARAAPGLPCGIAPNGIPGGTVTASGSCGPGSARRGVTIIVNGEDLDPSPAAFIESGRTFVPMRAILEALSAEVMWVPDLRTATASTDKHVLVAQIGSQVITVDDKKYEMDASAGIIEERTFLPLRFTAAALDAAVEWYPSTRTVRVAQSGEAPDRLGQPGTVSLARRENHSAERREYQLWL